MEEGKSFMVKPKTVSPPIDGDWIFERYNSKYNRLWGQITDFIILIFQTTLGYIFAIMAIENLSLKVFAYSFILVVCILLLLCGVIGKLELERLETRNYLSNHLKGQRPHP